MQRYPGPKCFAIVEHFAGDSTINSVSVGTFTKEDKNEEDCDNVVIMGDVDNNCLFLLFFIRGIYITDNFYN
jgi:hypothetical protein